MLKLLRTGKTLGSILAQGLEQTADYADRIGVDEVHLVVFHRAPDMPWEDRIWTRQERFEDWEILVWGC